MDRQNLPHQAHRGFSGRSSISGTSSTTTSVSGSSSTYSDDRRPYGQNRCTKPPQRSLQQRREQQQRDHG